MRLLWDLYWPALLFALLIGAGLGTAGLRRRWRRRAIFAASILAAAAGVVLWHGPIGAGERYRATIDGAARDTLVYYELPAVDARLDSGPQRRSVTLRGPADAFQRTELVRIMGELPGVGPVRWADQPASRGWPLPLLAEAIVAGWIAGALGLVLAFLIELRRRARAEWRW